MAWLIGWDERTFMKSLRMFILHSNTPKLEPFMYSSNTSKRSFPWTFSINTTLKSLIHSFASFSSASLFLDSNTPSHDLISNSLHLRKIA